MLATPQNQVAKRRLQQDGMKAPQGPSTFSGTGPVPGQQQPQPGTGSVPPPGGGMSPTQALAQKYAQGGGAPTPLQGGQPRPTGGVAPGGTPPPGGVAPGYGINNPPPMIGTPGAGGAGWLNNAQRDPNFVPPPRSAVQPGVQTNQQSFMAPGQVMDKMASGIGQVRDRMRETGQDVKDTITNTGQNVVDTVKDAAGNVDPNAFLKGFNPLALLQQWGLIPAGIDVSGGMGIPGMGGGGGGGGMPPRSDKPNPARGNPAWVPDGGDSNRPHIIPDTTPGSGHGDSYVKDTRPPMQVDPTGGMEVRANVPGLSGNNPVAGLSPLGQRMMALGGAGSVDQPQGNVQGQMAAQAPRGGGGGDLPRGLAVNTMPARDSGAHGNIQARDAAAGAGAQNWADQQYPNAEGGPLGAMADWMTSGDINRLKKNIGSFNDMNSEALNALRAAEGDYGQAGVTGTYSRDAARQMSQNAIDRQYAQAQRDLEARDARGGVVGTGAAQGLARAAMEQGKDAELQLQNRAFQEEMGRLGALNNARGNLADQLSAGSRIDMENLLNNYTSNKELFGQLLGFIPELVGNVMPF